MLEEGGIYAMRAPWGRWNIFRVLKVTASAAHVRFYKRRFWRKPTLAQFDRDDWVVGHMPIDRSSAEHWQSEHIGTLPVLEDELEGYRIWEHDEDAGVLS